MWRRDLGRKAGNSHALPLLLVGIEVRGRICMENILITSDGWLCILFAIDCSGIQHTRISYDMSG